MKPRKMPVPKSIASTVQQACKVSYDLMVLIKTARRWPCVRAELETWANSCRADNTGWAEYEFAQRVLAELIGADRHEASRA